MSKLKEKATEYIEKGKEQINKIPPNPACKAGIGAGKKICNYIKKTPADAILALGISLVAFDIDRMADTVEEIDPTEYM